MNECRGMILAGGGEIKPLSMQPQTGCDVVVTRSSNSKDVTALEKNSKINSLLKSGRTVCVTAQYIVSWLSKPWTSLDQEVVAGNKPDSLANMESQRGTLPDPASIGKYFQGSHTGLSMGTQSGSRKTKKARKA